MFLTNCPPWWIAPYGYLQFSWEEKLVVHLIAAPKVDNALEDKNEGKKARLQATRATQLRKGEQFFFCSNLDEVLYNLR